MIKVVTSTWSVLRISCWINFYYGIKRGANGSRSGLFRKFGKKSGMPAVYNFNPQIYGNTFEERALALKRSVNGVLQTLVGASATFTIKRPGSDRVWYSVACPIVDPQECVVKIPEIKNLTLTPHVYVWDITVTYADGDIKTYIGGEMPIIAYPQNHTPWPIQ